MQGCQDNESCSNILNFLERLDDRIKCTHRETVAVVSERAIYVWGSCSVIQRRPCAGDSSSVVQRGPYVGAAVVSFREGHMLGAAVVSFLSLIHISEPTRLA